MVPSVYIETTVPSYLTGRRSRHPVTLARQEATRAWWIRRRSSFDCYTSQVVLSECEKGDAEASQGRIKALRTLAVLEVDDSAEQFAKNLLGAGIIPPSVPDDALHLSLAVLNGMSFLLTWNFRHLANAARAETIRAFCFSMGYVPPVICTPEELMEPI